MSRLKLFGEPEGGGTDDHSALLNLGYAQSGHSGFVPSQGEALIDILRLNQNIIRDSGGNDRITLSTASPHLTLSGDTRVASGVLSVGGSPSADSRLLINPTLVGVSGTNYLARLQPDSANLTGVATLYGLYGICTASIAAGGSLISRALAYTAYGSGAGTINELTGVHIFLGTQLFTGSLQNAYGINITQPFWAGNKPVTSYGMRIQSPATSTAGVTTAYSLRIDDIEAGATNKYLIHAGPSTPYLRLVGGAAPAANLTNLYLNEGGTLRRVQVKDGGSIGAGDRVMVLV